MKIGIITILKVNNYGAELQAFALQRKLNAMGYDAEIIDYLYYKNKGHKRERISMPTFPFPLKKRVKEILLPIVENVKSWSSRKAHEHRNEGFVAFHQRNTRFSEVQYTSYSQLYSNVPEYDVYCVGSDQVWNPGCYTSLNPYFLTFAPKGKKRISYGSSFGVSEIPENAKQYFQSALNGLDFIAVREQTGKGLVNSLTGREATVVVDPTLLLSKEEWSNVAKYDKVPEKDYLLIYDLRDSEIVTQTALHIAKERGLSVVRICKTASSQDNGSNGILNIVDAAPDDFIGLFSKAKFVVTNSFHGTVFSNIFQKDFYSVLPCKRDNNSRVVDLLNRLGNQDRLVYEGDKLPNIATVDWGAVREALKEYVKQSEQYLYESIG